jgi:hypothetical protein
MSGRTKVYTNQCKVCIKCAPHPEYGSKVPPIVEMCTWGKSKKYKELIKPLSGIMLDCKLIGKGGV